MGCYLEGLVRQEWGDGCSILLFSNQTGSFLIVSCFYCFFIYPMYKFVALLNN